MIIVIKKTGIASVPYFEVLKNLLDYVENQASHPLQIQSNDDTIEKLKAEIQSLKMNAHGEPKIKSVELLKTEETNRSSRTKVSKKFRIYTDHSSLGRKNEYGEGENI